MSQGRKAGGKRRKVGGDGGEGGEGRGGEGGVGEIVLLPCSQCRTRTVLYPCTCKQVLADLIISVISNQLYISGFIGKKYIFIS